MDSASNLQRAFWTFLGYMLVGPFLGGLAVALALGLAPLLGLQDLLPEGLPPAGAATVSAYLWSVLPAAIATTFVVPLVLWRGRLGWLEAAVAGVVAFGVAAAFVLPPYPDVLGQLAFLAGLTSLVVRQALLAGNIIRS